MWTVASAIPVSDTEHQILQRLVQAPSTPQGIAKRCRIVLLAQEGIANHSIARALSISRPTVLLWRSKFMTKGSVYTGPYKLHSTHRLNYNSLYEQKCTKNTCTSI